MVGLSSLHPLFDLTSSQRKDISSTRKLEMGETTAGFDELRQFIVSCLGSELDESAPLSASDLRILSQRIQTRSSELKDRVRLLYSDIHEQCVTVVRNSVTAASEVELVEEDLKRIDEYLGDRAFDIEMCELAAEAEQLRREQEERRQYIAGVEFIAEVHGSIQTAEKEFLRGDLVEAAADLCEIREQLGLPAEWTGDRDDEKEREKKVEKVKSFILLEDEWAQCYAKLRSFLEGLFSKAVMINTRGSELCISSSVSCSHSAAGVEMAEVQLSTILSAMDHVGVLDTMLAKTADALFKQIIDPIIHDSRHCVLNMPKQGVKAVLRWNPSTEKTGNTEHTKIYSELLDIFKFLRTNLLVENDEWMQHFGHVIWPQFAESIIANRLRKAVPNETSEFAEFQELAQVTADFETSLGRANLIPDWNETEGDKLRRFSSDVELHFAVKKRKQVVAKARNLLVASDYKTFLINVEEKTRQGSDESDSMSLLQTEACAITYPAKQLLELVHDTLQDACQSSASIAMELYHATRDALLLYRSIVPIKVIEQLNSIHKIGALCHNDCFYIAHNLLFLDFQYSAALPTKVQKIMSFVDLVPLFRRLGCEILEKQIHLIKVDLMEKIDQANGFQYTEQKRYYDNSSNAISQAVIVLEAVRTVWQPVLATSVWEFVVGNLMEAVVKRLIDEVFAFDDISVGEGELLRKLMIAALESMSSLFRKEIRELEGGAGNQSTELVRKWVPSWRKLERLTDLLDMSLRPISQSWESGDLSSCGFSADEVQHLIKAIFSETPLRTECLKLIVERDFKEQDL